ncbi:MAG: aminotransferase class I/II-fold pyridoxal phosphate-dependent enzyme [Thermomicrobiales bacterium]
MAAIAETFDALTSEQLTGVLGRKWTSYPDCIGAFVAEMDYGTAPAVQQALRDAVEANFFGYVPQQALDDLQKATSRWYRDLTGWDVPASRISVIADVLTGMQYTIEHFSRAGSKIIVPTPAYMPFLSLPGVLGREVIEVPMLNQHGTWTYDLDGIDKAFADGGGLLVICNPHNPIGKVLHREEMEALSEVVARHNGRVFSDEIHAPLVYPGQKHIPYASINDVAASHTVTSIAASKAWNIAGLKCAQLVISNDADAEVWKVAGAFNHGASTLGVVASTAGYNDGRDWLAEVIAYLDGNRKLLGRLVEEHLPGAQYSMPEGTYLAWIDLTQTPLDGDLGVFFREEAKVAITDGSACGVVGRRCIRFNLAMPRHMMEQALRQMGEAIAAVQVPMTLDDSSRWFDVREADPGVWVIEEPFHVEQVKSYLIAGSERAILLDTGMGVANIRAVVETLTDLPVSVVNSHAHWDHIGGNHLFAEIAIHPAEAADLEGGVPNAVLRPWFAPKYLTGPLPDRVTAETIAIPPSRATHLLADGETIDLGGRMLEVIHGPGHSPGGISLLDRVNGLLFSTDVAYAGALYVYARDDLPVYQRSLERLAALAPDLRMVLPCHNECPMSPDLLPRMAAGVGEIVSGRLPDWRRGSISGWVFDGFSFELKPGDDEP